MNKTTIVTIIYIIGIIIGALFVGIWDAQTSIYKALYALIWTAMFLVALFFADKKKKLIK